MSDQWCSLVVAVFVIIVINYSIRLVPLFLMIDYRLQKYIETQLVGVTTHLSPHVLLKKKISTHIHKGEQCLV